jgi:osmotically-inducible protein OsmY
MTFAEKENKKKIADQTIVEHIQNEIRQNSMIKADKVDIKVKNGIVTISGIVPDQYNNMAVYNAAECTDGVKNVINNLSVE